MLAAKIPVRTSEGKDTIKEAKSSPLGATLGGGAPDHRLVALARHLSEQISWPAKESACRVRLDARSHFLEGPDPVADVTVANHDGGGGAFDHTRTRKLHPLNAEEPSMNVRMTRSSAQIPLLDQSPIYSFLTFR